MAAEEAKDIINNEETPTTPETPAEETDFEALLQGAAGETALEALGHIDVLVDGPFVKDLMPGKHIFRGSSNQRLIDVRASLAAQDIVAAEL